MSILDENKRVVLSILSEHSRDEEILGECSAHVNIEYCVHYRTLLLAYKEEGMWENQQADFSPHFHPLAEKHPRPPKPDDMDNIYFIRLIAARHTTTASDFFKKLFSHDILANDVKGKYYVALTNERIILFRHKVPRFLLGIIPRKMRSAKFAYSFLQIPYYEVESIEEASDEIRMSGSDLNFSLNRMDGIASHLLLAFLKNREIGFQLRHSKKIGK